MGHCSSFYTSSMRPRSGTNPAAERMGAVSRFVYQRLTVYIF